MSSASYQSIKSNRSLSHGQSPPQPPPFTPLPLQSPKSLDLKPLLHLSSLLPTVSKRALALRIPRTIPATWQVSFFARKVGTAFRNPADHTTAAEVIPTVALRVVAGLFGFDQRTRLVGFVGLHFGFAVDVRKTLFVLCTGFARVFWSIAVCTDLEFAVGTGEDAAVFLALVSLDGLESIAVVHANVALLQCHLHGVAEGVGHDSNRQRLASTPAIIDSPILGPFAG